MPESQEKPPKGGLWAYAPKRLFLIILKSKLAAKLVFSINFSYSRWA